MSLLEAVYEFAQRLRDLVFIEFIRERDPKVEPRFGFDAGQHHVGPVCHIPPTVHKKVPNTAALEFMPCSSIVGEEGKP